MAFTGVLTCPWGVDVTMRSPTEFENRVYDAVRRIPRGKVATYKMVAEHIGCGSRRAIGQALKRNPYAPEVPCHRVIASDMTLGGFAGESSGPELVRKRRLLEREGIKCKGDGLVAEKRKVQHKF